MKRATPPRIAQTIPLEFRRTERENYLEFPWLDVAMWRVQLQANRGPAPEDTACMDTRFLAPAIRVFLEFRSVNQRYWPKFDSRENYLNYCKSCIINELQESR